MLIIQYVNNIYTVLGDELLPLHAMGGVAMRLVRG